MARQKSIRTKISTGDEVPTEAVSPLDPETLETSSAETFQETLQNLRTHQSALELQIADLRRKQRDLEFSEIRYFDLYDLAPVGYLTLSDRCVIVEANLAAANMLRVPRSSLAGVSMIRFLCTEDRECCLGMYRTLRDQGGHMTAELRLRRSDRSTFWTRIDLAATGADSPNFLVVLSDITERKQTEHAQIFLSQLVARDSDEEYLRAVVRYLGEKLDAALVCVTRLSADVAVVGTEVLWIDGEFAENESYALQGTPCEKLSRQTQICFPSKVVSMFPADEMLTRIGAESYFGIALRSLDGRTIGLIAVIWRTPLTDPAFVSSLLNTVSVRVSSRLEQRLADEKLEHSMDMLRRVGELARIGGWELDAETRRLTFSEVTFQLHEIDSRQEPTLEEAIFFYPDDAREMIRNAVANGLEFGQSWNLDLPFVTAKGRRIWVNAMGEAETQSGRVIRLFGTFRDITRAREEAEVQRQLETQLRHSQKMEAVGQLAGGIAHDFNNILTVINGTADLAAMRLSADHPIQEDLASIRLAGDRAAALTRQLVTFSRKQVDSPQILDINQLITEMRPMLRRLIREDIHLVLHTDSTPARAKLDSGNVEQVIMNLCVNARDAMPNGGTLSISSGHRLLTADEAAASGPLPAGRYVSLTIMDTGSGMSEETCSRIFEPFFTTKDVGQGTGLGLSTVYGIVTRSGGQIKVYSRLGVGTTFTILIPEAQDIPGDVVSAPQESLRQGSETILLVEDEPALLQLVSQVLKVAGYQVITAPGAREALHAISGLTGPLHLLLTDVVMPEMNGKKLAAMIASSRPEVKVLFTSGYTQELSLHDADSQDSRNFIAKPYRLPDLTRKVREVLDSPSSVHCQ
jgi:PAS domain S-box-containing protein